jgi:hypothetical protein
LRNGDLVWYRLHITQEWIAVSATTEFDRDRFMKLLAHLDNENDNEALAAVRHARAMLQRAGMKFSEVPKLFATHPDIGAIVERTRREAAEARRRAQEEKAERRRQAKEQAEAAERARAELRRRLEPKRQALIARYGSERAAFAARGLERSVETACALAVKEYRMTRRGRCWNERTDEWPKEVIAAIRRPGPFPRTITAAKAELNYWTEREAELALLNYSENGDFLSRACRERQRMVESRSRRRKA